MRIYRAATMRAGSGCSLSAMHCVTAFFRILDAGTLRFSVLVDPALHAGTKNEGLFFHRSLAELSDEGLSKIGCI
jgi:hypothetical protein